MLGNRILPIELLSYNTATCDGTYKVLTASLAQPCSELIVANDSDKDVTLSFDGGTTDHMYVKSGYSFPINAQEMAIAATGIAKIAKGTKISLKSAVGTGLFHVSGWYSK